MKLLLSIPDPDWEPLPPWLTLSELLRAILSLG
jgi:hypothetical protein